MSKFRQYSYLYIPIVFLLTSLLMDVIMYAFMRIPFASDYIYSLFLMLVVTVALCLTQRKWLQITIASIFLALQTFFCGGNIVTSITLKEIFSLETFLSFRNITAAQNNGDLELWFLIPMLFLLTLYIVTVVNITLICRRPITKRPWWRRLVGVGLVVVILFSNLICCLAVPAPTQSYTQNVRNYRFNTETFFNRQQNLRLYGTYSYYLNNLLYLLTWKKSASEVLGISVQNELVADDLGYDLLRDEQLDQDNNLIMILLETFELAAINPLTTPNLYQFMTEDCLSVDGYYSMERTCMTDYISQTGAHAVGQEMWASYGNVPVPMALGNIFGAAGYETSAFHNYRGSFYDRANVYTKNLGFQNFYDYTALSEQFTGYFNGNKDELMIKEHLAAGRLAPADRHFYNYIVSVSSHGIVPEADLREHYPDEFAYLDANQTALAEFYPWLATNDARKIQTTKNYLAGVMNFDRGFGALLDHLRTTPDQKNPGKTLYETTALVMFGDHYYYMYPNAVAPENPKIMGNKSPFLIYNPRASAANRGRTIERFTATMDIYKTVCSLFNIVTDQQITYGRSVLVYDALPDADKTAYETVAVGYMNGCFWGMTPDGKKWRTLDFKKYWGTKLTPDEKTHYAAIVDRIFNSIILDTTLFRQNGFQTLSKCHYRLG